MNFRDFIAILFMILIFGFGAVVVKVCLGEFPPFTMASLKFTITAVLLSRFLPSPKRLKLLFLHAFLMVTCISLIFIAANRLDAGTAVISYQLVVPFGSLLAAVFFKDKLGIKGWFAMAFTFVGIGILVGDPTLKNPMYVFIMILGAFVAASTTVVIKHLSELKPLAITAWTMVFGAPMMLVLCLIFESNQLEIISAAGWKGWSALAYNIIGDSIIACTLWFYLLGKYRINQVAPFTLITPVIGVLGGVMVLNEELTWRKFAGGLIIISSVAIIVLYKNKIVENKVVEAVS